MNRMFGFLSAAVSAVLSARKEATMRKVRFTGLQERGMLGGKRSGHADEGAFAV